MSSVNKQCTSAVSHIKFSMSLLKNLFKHLNKYRLTDLVVRVRVRVSLLQTNCIQYGMQSGFVVDNLTISTKLLQDFMCITMSSNNSVAYRYLLVAVFIDLI